MKKHKRKHFKKRLVIPKIPSTISPVHTRQVNDMFLRPVFRIPYSRPKIPKKARHRKVIRKPRIVGVRAIDISEPVGYRWYSQSSVKDGGPLTSQSFSTYTVLGNNTRTGTTNPHWKDLVRGGVTATTSMLGTNWFQERSYWQGLCHGTSYRQSNGAVTRQWDYTVGMLCPFPSFTPGAADTATVTDVHNRCIAQFLEKVSAARSSENLTGRSIKHFRHDVHSTLHPMAGIQAKTSEYLTKLEKVPYGKLKGPRLYSVISQAYLEYKFGVAPFVTDISDIVSDMVIRDRKRNPSVPVQATAHRRYSGQTLSVNPSNGVTFMDAFQPKQNVLITSTYSERFRGAIRTGINDEGKLGVIQDNKLLPEDWLPTIFSIMPYAWMVNYFTNIREIIDAASFRFADLVWCQSTSRDVTTVSSSDIIFLNPNLQAGVSGEYQIFSSVSSGGHSIVEVTKVTRFATFPSEMNPSFAFSIPVTSTPWVNMMAAFSPRIFSIVKKFTS